MRVGDVVRVGWTGTSYESMVVEGETGIIVQRNAAADEDHRWTVFVAGEIYAFSTKELDSVRSSQ